MFRCIYCDREKPLNEKSKEHIWPERLGGEQSPEFYKTDDVCTRCNNLAGLFVDGDFIRNHFTGVEHISSNLHFLDTTIPQALPLIYTGICNEQPPEVDEICEQWLGPRGERIFYFHKKDREDFIGYARGDPIRRQKKDPGRAYLSLARPNIYWMFTAFFSVRRTFKRAEIRMLTRLDAPEINNECAEENSVSEADRSFIAPLLAQSKASTHYTIMLDHGVRFQCKIALGFGYALFGEQFRDLKYTQILREGLWESDPQKLSKLKLFGTSRLSGARDVDEEMIGFRGAYTFAFMHGLDSTMLMVYSPHKRAMRTLITQEIDQNQDSLFRKYSNEFVILLVPGQSRFLGPYPLSSYALHRSGIFKIAELEQLENSYKTIDQIEKAVEKWEIPHK